jgi:hypothetical protein
MSHLSRSDERGSALVSVMVIMFVLTIFALTAAAMVANTGRTATFTSGTTQSRAAADAGIATALGAFRAGTLACSGTNKTTASASGATPQFSVACALSGVTTTGTTTTGKATFTSTGRSLTGADVVVESVFSYRIVTSAPAAELDDLTFFGDATFTQQTNTISGGKLSLAIPKGNLECHNVIPANIKVYGNFLANTDGCDVTGSVTAGGTISSDPSGSHIRGNATSASTGTSVWRGAVGGNFWAAGNVEFDWGSKRSVDGNLTAAGNVTLYTDTVGGNVTVPASKMLTATWQSTVNLPAGSHSQVGGTISRPASVTSPTAPTFEAWREYAFNAADWSGYDLVVLDTTAKCNHFNRHPGGTGIDGWNALATEHDRDTIIDARLCADGLTSNYGTAATAIVRHNYVFVANKFDLTPLTLKPAAGADVKAWFIVPDADGSKQPDTSLNCGGSHSININSTYITVPSFAYTPGCIKVSGGGVFTGTMYGGGFSHGGLINIYGQKVGFPGDSGGSSSGGGGAGGTLTITGLVSQRDKP